MKIWAIAADFLLAAAFLSVPATWVLMILIGSFAPQLINHFSSLRLALGLFQLAAPFCCAALYWSAGTVACHRSELLKPEMRRRVQDCRGVALVVMLAGLLWAGVMNSILQRSLREYGTQFPSERHQVKVSPTA